jgi:hypothetical protein
LNAFLAQYKTVRSTRQVCQHVPRAGAETSGTVKLVLDRPGECSTVSGAEKTIPRLGGRSGWM